MSMLVEPITATKPQESTTPNVKQERKPEARAKAPGRFSESEEATTQDTELLKDVLRVAERHFHIRNVGLEFEVHDGTGRLKVTVVDKETGDIIREVPPQQVLDMVAKLDEMMGILFEQKA
jgi:flagellar protein FlaG